jgi:hypothetical protein
MHYKVKLPISTKNTTSDGYLQNWIDTTQPALYPRGEALKKANAFGGKIEKVDYSQGIIETTITEIDGSLLLLPIRQLINMRELFAMKDNANTLIYNANIFITLRNELVQLGMENYDFKVKTEILNQLNELSQMVTSEYVLIKDMCFS